MTDFQTKCGILGDFYSDYKHEKDFEDFMEFNDLGLPLAYFVAQSLCNPSDDGVIYINETWELFLASLGLTDTRFTNLEEVFLAAETDA